MEVYFIILVDFELELDIIIVCIIFRLLLFMGKIFIGLLRFLMVYYKNIQELKRYYMLVQEQKNIEEY